MTRSLRPVGYAAAFLLTAGVGIVGAQTVVVRSAPPAATAEVVFGSAVGTAVADSLGDATVVLANSPAAAAEVSAAIYADVCGTVVRITLVGRTTEAPAPAAGCQRWAVPGFFAVQRGTSLVIDLAAGEPTVRITQGRVPAAWLRHGPAESGPGRLAPRGLVLFGGGGLANMSDEFEFICGEVTGCVREDLKFAYGGGVAYWLTPWLGGEVGLVKTLAFVGSGGDEGYQFRTTIEPWTFTVAALPAVRVGAMRAYLRIGANYHRAVFRTTQNIEDKTVDVDGTPVTLPGATQTFVYETVGWGPAFGGGLEGWIGDSAAIFGDYSYLRLEGENIDDRGGVRAINDRAHALLFGLKFHLLGRR